MRADGKTANPGWCYVVRCRGTGGDIAYQTYQWQQPTRMAAPGAVRSALTIAEYNTLQNVQNRTRCQEQFRVSIR